MILLHTTKYGDSSLILHGYTRDGGRQSFMLRGVGKRGSKGVKALGYLHSLNVLDVEAQGGADGIRYIKEFSPKFSLNSLRSNIFKSSIVMYISELLYKSLVESEQDEMLYDFLEKSIVTLDSLEDNFANFHIWFTIQYASRLGFMPGKGFSAEFNPFSEEEKNLLERFLEGDCGNAMQISLRGEQRTAFLTSLLKYLEYHLGSRLDIKSLSVLHQVMGV